MNLIICAERLSIYKSNFGSQNFTVHQHYIYNWISFKLDRDILTDEKCVIGQTIIAIINITKTLNRIKASTKSQPLPKNPNPS